MLRGNRFISIIAVSALTIGTIFYHIVERLSWLDAIYFSVITLASVGYGDIVPKTIPGKIFTIFYVLIGIGIIAAFANALIRKAVVRRIDHLNKKQSEAH